MGNFLTNQTRGFLFGARPEICPDVAAWAVKKNIPVCELFPPVAGEVGPHLGDDAAAQAEFARHREALERPQTLVAIENAFVRDAVGLVELPDGQVCHEGNWWLPLLQENPAYGRRFFFKRRQLKGNFHSLLGLWSSEYYHWFHDILPRLENALPHLPADTRFLINENPRSFQLESLKAYGINAGQLEFQPPGVRTKIERLWFATPAGHSTFGSGKVVARVANRLKKFFLDNQINLPPRRVYISRQKARTRRVVNESGLKPLLKEQGFEFLVVEDLTWLAQLQIFSAAAAIIGPHGAGLMNLMFTQENAAVWEISASPETVPCYLMLARQLGCQFRRLHAQAVGDETIADMNLPVEMLAGNFLK